MSGLLVVIACAGDGVRWGDTTGVPKHLAVVGRESLLTRTVRQLRERGVTDIAVVTRTGCDGRYYVGGARQVAASQTGASIDKMLSSAYLWLSAPESRVLMGDVWFSDDAMDKIVAPLPADGWAWYSRFGPSEFTGCPYGEGFAVGLTSGTAHRYAQVCAHLRELWLRGEIHRCYGWEAYKLMCGVADDDLVEHVDLGNRVEIDDWTDDFDTPDDYLRYMSRRGPRSVRELAGLVGAVSVVHVGAHLGEEVPGYLEWARHVTLVEPNPQSADFLLTRWSSERRVLVEPVACSALAGVMALNLTADTQLCSLNTPLPCAPGYAVTGQVKVPVTRVADLAPPGSILVVDAQGHEVEVMEGAAGGGFRAAVVEARSPGRYEGTRDWAGLIRALRPLGWRPVAIYPHGDVETAGVWDVAFAREFPGA